ncbi:acyltransferase family protein [Burkholderia vietnamiensis]|uniref:acyltransferase family protein n=1 Tax=Burkholderia vietnamiensis TaxID=60552 RepID=UPI001B9AD577|nr:acyltransferase [Burkholderia vietnamiensis]MBR7998255.1 acyltransferase [Burkholderia vietnamiensis]
MTSEDTIPVEVTRGAGKALALEGLRGVAALAVVFSHCFYTFFPFLQTGEKADQHAVWEFWLLNNPLRVFYNGTFAVTVFFVMSGYVLTRKFFENGDVRSLQDGAAKRYIRLGIPVGTSVLLGYTLMCAHAFPANLTHLGGFIEAAYGFQPSLALALSDSVFGSLVFGHAQYNYILWTIGVEFLGSLLLFAYLALFGHTRYRTWVAAAISVALIIAEPVNGILYALFFVGMFMHTWRLVRSPWAIAACVLSGLYFGGYHWYSKSYLWLVDVANALVRVGIHLEWPVLFPAIGSVFLVAAILGKNRVSAFLSLRPIVWLGDKSFSLYLTHTFVLSSVGMYAWLGTPSLPYQTRAWLSIAAVVVVSLIVAAAFARLVDAPAVKLAQKFCKYSRVNSAGPSSTVRRSL